jgi:hypothetical protein
MTHEDTRKPLSKSVVLDEIRYLITHATFPYWERQVKKWGGRVAASVPVISSGQTACQNISSHKTLPDRTILSLQEAFTVAAAAYNASVKVHDDRIEPWAFKEYHRGSVSFSVLVVNLENGIPLGREIDLLSYLPRMRRFLLYKRISTWPWRTGMAIGRFLLVRIFRVRRITRWIRFRRSK